MPERAVYEHRDSPRLPSQIGLTGKPLVKPPSSDTRRPQAPSRSATSGAVSRVLTRAMSRLRSSLVN